MEIFEAGAKKGELRDLNQCMDMLGGGADEERAAFLKWAQSRKGCILD
jgi:hypothetical protein